MKASPGPDIRPLSLGRHSNTSKEAEESQTAAQPSHELLPGHSGEYPDDLHHSVVCQQHREGPESSAQGHHDGPNHHLDTAAGR